MIGDDLKINDQVEINIDQESRNWGYKPCPDGTKAVVTGFAEIAYGRISNFGRAPGIYENRSWVHLKTTTGKELVESATRLTMPDQAEYKKRRNARTEPKFLRSLPETPFWEGDIVAIPSRSGCCGYQGETFTITGIDYHTLGTFCNDGKTPYPAYTFSSHIGAGWSSSARESEMTLLRRGNVWNFYHGIPMEFANIQEEADFYHQIGHTDDVRNPANDLYKWTKHEVLDAIREGTIHGFSMSGGFFATGLTISAVRYRNEEVGKRVAAATLKGFDA